MRKRKKGGKGTSDVRKGARKCYEMRGINEEERETWRGWEEWIEEDEERVEINGRNG